MGAAGKPPSVGRLGRAAPALEASRGLQADGVAGVKGVNLACSREQASKESSCVAGVTGDANTSARGHGRVSPCNLGIYSGICVV